MTLRKYMKDNNLSYGTVSKQTGIDRKALWAYWNGKQDITLNMAKKLHKAYGNTLWHWWQEGAKKLAQDSIDVGERDPNLPAMFFAPDDLARLKDEVVVIDDFGIDTETGGPEWYRLTDGRIIDAYELKLYEPNYTRFREGSKVKVCEGMCDDVSLADSNKTYRVIEIDHYDTYILKLECVETGEQIQDTDCYFTYA